MTAIQMGITIAVCTAATMLTRFLPFVVFSSKDQQPPEVVRYLGRLVLLVGVVPGRELCQCGRQLLL